MGASYRTAFPAAGPASYPTAGRRLYRGGGGGGGEPVAIPWAGYYTAAGITDVDAQTAIDAFGAGLASDGLDSKVKVFVILGGETAGAINVIQDAYHGSLVGGPNFLQWLGVQGNGVDSYISTGTALGSITGLGLNSTSVGIGTNQGAPANGQGYSNLSYMYAESYNSSYEVTTIYPSFLNDSGQEQYRVQGEVNDGFDGTNLPAEAWGTLTDVRFYASRTGASAKKVYRGSTEKISDTNSSVAFPGVPLFIAASNLDGTPDLSVFFGTFATKWYCIAEGLSGAEIAALDARIVTLITALEALNTTYDADAVAYILSAGITNATYINAINTFVKDLKAASLWTKFDRLWLFANESATAALTCLKSLETATAVNSPTFAAGEGYTFNGSTQYLNSGLNLNAGGEYQRDSGSYGYYARAANGTSNQCPVGVWSDSAAIRAFMLYVGASDFNAEVNNGDAAALAAATGGRTGLWHLNRTASNALAAYKSGSSVDTGTTASVDISGVSQPFFFGAFNFTGSPFTFFDGQLSMGFIGAGFDSTEAAAFDTCVDTLKTAIGF